MSDLDSMTLEELLALKAKRQAATQSSSMTAPEIALDTAKSTGVGLGEGVMAIAGLPGDINNLAKSASGYILDKIGATEGAKALRNYGEGLLPSTGTITGGVEKVTGKFYEPKSGFGRLGRTLGQFAPAAAVGGGAVIPRIAEGVIAPALGNFAGGEMFDGNPYAKAIGTLIGAVTPSGARRLITPFPAEPGHRAAVDVLRGEGVNTSAGRATGHKRMMYAESEIGGQAAVRQYNREGEEFTRATLQRAGIDAPRATLGVGGVVDQGLDSIGNQFDTLSARAQLPITPQTVNRLQTAYQEYFDFTPAAMQLPIIKKLVDNFRSVQGSTAPGEVYQAFRSQLDKAARGVRGNVQASDALYEMRNALDDAAETMMAPGEAAAWREARRHYRNMLVIERAATAPGAEAAGGIISPAHLRTADMAVGGRRAYARGRTDFSELAQAGNQVMTKMPESGTGARRGIETTLRLAGGALGHFGGGGSVMELPTIIGAAMGPAVAGEAMMSRPVQAWLRNQLLPGETLADASRRVMLTQALTNRQPPEQ